METLSENFTFILLLLLIPLACMEILHHKLSEGYAEHKIILRTGSKVFGTLAIALALIALTINITL
jgi:hypothetical protein